MDFPVRLLVDVYAGDIYIYKNCIDLDKRPNRSIRTAVYSVYIDSIKTEIKTTLYTFMQSNSTSHPLNDPSGSFLCDQNYASL
jgi:hypothetical protein